MTTPLRSLHHVTATVAGAQADLDFCRGLLALRLVKKTVNFDNHSVYHFYYGDERGSPGTIWTTFPYAGQGVARGIKGAGQITVTAFSVPRAALPYWRARLAERSQLVEEVPLPFGEEAIRVVDPSGLLFDLVAGAEDARAPWSDGAVPPGQAIRGLHSVRLSVRDRRPSERFLVEVLGFDPVDEADGCTRLAVGGNRPGGLVDLVDAGDAPDARNGLGTVHHVAFAVGTPEEQLAMREDLLHRGVTVTPVMDRQYFRSIYFREPGGVLYEIATLGPGFTRDEPLADLGRSLRLPPWEEDHRAEIETALPVVTD